MVGRGTRIDEASGKLMFRVYDYTDATRLFGEEFLTRLKAKGPDDPAGGGGGSAGPRTVWVAGFDARVRIRGGTS